jgi:hypothetical protein
VLPTVFDAAAFHAGKTISTRKSLTTCIDYVNKNGQVVTRNTPAARNKKIFSGSIRLAAPNVGMYMVQMAATFFNANAPLAE